MTGRAMSTPKHRGYHRRQAIRNAVADTLRLQRASAGSSTRARSIKWRG